MKDINQITFCAIMSALNVVLMFFGSIFGFATMLVAAFCGYMNIVIVNEIKFSRAICSYFIVCFLANFFVARKAILIEYVLFNGIYPIIEHKISNLESLFLKSCCKILIFCMCSFFIINLNIFLLGLNNITTEKTKMAKTISYAAMLIWCYCFDYFLQDLKRFYTFKLRHRLFKTFISLKI